MNKTITLIAGALVPIALSTFLILGKIDLTTFGTLSAAISGVVYGFYQKVENKELLETNMTLDDNQTSYKYTIEQLTKANENLVYINDSLKRDLQISNSKLKVATIQTKAELTPAIAEVVTKLKPKSKTKK